MYEHGEKMFADPDVDDASKRGQTLRGTGREAGRYEQALRLIGRRVNADQGALVLIVDQGEAFMVRMLTQGTRDLPYRYVMFRTAELEQIEAEAVAARTGTEVPAFPAAPTRGRGRTRKARKGAAESV
jgi:hypothetical protein